jgi:two-component system, NtrC family, sensor kinase
MRRRSRASGKLASVRGRKAKPLKVVRSRSSSAPGKETELARLTRERNEALEQLSEALKQQTAASEVLRLISGSPGELGAVFDAMLVNATKLCEARFGILLLWEGDAFRTVALHNASPAFAEHRRREPVIRPPPATSLGRLVATKQVDHIADMRAEKAYVDGHPGPVSLVELAGARTVINVPMLKERELIGCIALYRQEVRPFTDKQIALLQTFAAQAVIAIENARLLNELRESLQQQTATADVLKVISRSTFDLQIVLNTLVESAAQLCDADIATMHRQEGMNYHAIATYGGPPGHREASLSIPFEAGRGSVIGRTVLERKSIQITDVLADPEYSFQKVQQKIGYRTVLGVPLLREGHPVGAIVLMRLTVQPFTEKQIELVTTFADQAVIAIENVRLFEAEQQRTRELSESLDQQTATSEVLRVISSSPGDLEPVFDAMLQNSVRICEAGFGQMFLCEGDNVRLVATVSVPTALIEFDKRRGTFQPSPGGGLDRLIRTKQVVHIADLASEHASYPPATLGGARSYIAVPMLREGELVGAIAIYRQEVRPFTERQIALVTNFAAQAVIAIENTRLLNELRQSLEQQTATSDVLKVISSSPGDLAPVFHAMLENATRICEATFGSMLLRGGDAYRRVAQHNAPQKFEEFCKNTPILGRGLAPIVDQVIDTRQVSQALDIAAENPNEPIAKFAAARTLLVVPMLKDNEAVGVVGIYRQEVRPFTEKQIALVQNFASQAVIAIENTRLLNELRQSLQQQTATADVLKVISRSTFDLKTVLNTLVESAARLCEADMASVPRVTGGILDFFASYGYSPGFHEFLRDNPTSPGRGTVSGRAVLEGRTVHIPDVLADPEYDYGEGQKIGGYRTLLGVPLMREGAAIGALLLGRAAPRPFTPQQIELLETFADQAVIAIENVRLFDEIQEKSRQLEEASQHKSQFLANIRAAHAAQRDPGLYRING